MNVGATVKQGKFIMEGRWWNPRLNLASFCITSLVIHLVLIEVLARFDVISCIFAAGSHIPIWMLACTVTFVLVRVIVFFVIPAVLGWKVVAVLGRQFWHE